MLYMIVILSGGFMGAVILLGTGVPVVALRYLQCLPLDRRLWWTFAAIVAARCVRHIAIAENDYVVPTGGEKIAAFNAFLFGGYACVGVLWLVGAVALYWLGSKGSADPTSILTWPVAAVVLMYGTYLSVDHSAARRKEISERQAVVVAALKSGDIGTLKRLVTEGEKLHEPIDALGNREPFKYAIEKEDIAMIKFFLNRPKPDRPDLKIWMSNMMSTGNKEIFDIMMEEEGRNPKFLGHALNVAVSSDAREAFDRLLAMGADPNYVYNYTALMIAAQRNLQAYATALLAAGANVDTVHQSPWGNTNRTALSFAAEKGHVEMVRLLIQYKADPTVADADGKQPIDWAQSHGHEAVAKILSTASNRTGAQQ